MFTNALQLIPSSNLKSAAYPSVLPSIPTANYETVPPAIIVIVDTGTSTHSVPVPTAHQTRTPCAPTTVTLPNGSQHIATYTIQLPIPDLPTNATRAHVLPGFQQSLLSVGQLCDHGCIAVLDKQQVLILYNDKVIITGHRDPRTGLYTATLRPPTNQSSSANQSSSEGLSSEWLSSSRLLSNAVTQPRIGRRELGID